MTRYRKEREIGFKFSPAVLDYHNTVSVPEVIIQKYNDISVVDKYAYVALISLTKTQKEKEFTYDAFRSIFWDSRPSSQVDTEAVQTLKNLIKVGLIETVDIQRELYRLMPPELGRQK